MKSVFLLLTCAIFLPLNLFGQLIKGTWLLGGTGRLDIPTIISYDTERTYSYYEISLMPSFGYFITNRLMIGGSFGAYINFSPNARSGVDAALVNILPQVRYYFNPSNTKRNWFALAEGDPDVWRLGGGVDYFLSPSIALEGFAGVQWNGSSTAELNTNIGLQFFLKPNREKAADITLALDKGTVMLGGNGSISTWKAETWRFQASPNVGYFLSKRLVLGIRVETDHYFVNHNSDFRFSSLGISPFIRYYLNPESGRFLWFLMADAGVDKGFFKVGEDYISPSAYVKKHTTFSTSVRGGIDYFITSRVALEGTVGVHYSRFDNTLNTGMSEGNTLRIGADIGIQFFLSRE